MGYYKIHSNLSELIETHRNSQILSVFSLKGSAFLGLFSGISGNAGNAGISGKSPIIPSVPIVPFINLARSAPHFSVFPFPFSLFFAIFARLIYY